MEIQNGRAVKDKLEYFDVEIDDKGKFIVRKHITEHVKMCINSMT